MRERPLLREQGLTCGQPILTRNDGVHSHELSPMFVCLSEVRAGLSLFPRYRLEFGDVDLDHLHHGLHDALALFGIRIGHQFG